MTGVRNHKKLLLVLSLQIVAMVYIIGRSKIIVYPSSWFGYVSPYSKDLVDHFRNGSTSTEENTNPGLQNNSYTAGDLRLNKIMSSYWIKLFPHIKDMFMKIPKGKEFPNFNQSTSASKSRVYIISKNHRIGDTLEAKIQAVDYLFNAKTYGADFIRAILYRSTSARLIEGVSCDVQDEMNGKYKVFCPLMWTGTAELRVMLIHPSEGLYGLIMNSSGTYEPGVALKATVYNSKTGQNETVPCSFGFTGKYKNSQICDHSNPRNGEPWYCLKTTSGECPPIQWMDRYYDDVANDQTLGKRPFHKQYVNWRVLIQRLWTNIKNRDTGQINNALFGNSLACHRINFPAIPSNPMTATGWLHSQRWESTLCKNQEFKVQVFQRCMRNHTLYFIGDSTIRHLYNFIKTTINATDKGTDDDTSIWAQARNGRQEVQNITLHYRAHGPPLHNPGKLKVRPYITDTLDSISTTQTVIILTIGLHMDLYDPDIYLHRIKGISKALVKLKARLPDTRVFVKGHHVHAQSTRVCPSDWLSYRHDVLLRHVFKNVAGIIYLPVWDMTAVYNNQPYHPGVEILSKVIGMVQSTLRVE